ncbi:MAG: nitrilase-related carbon-nitrogen hydrolase [Eggerthellaceae bacterium]
MVLPELFSTGYELNIVGPHVPELAEPVDGPTVRALQDAARAGNCYVVAGLALAYDMAGVPFNSSVVIDRQGSFWARTTSSICGRSSAYYSARLRLPGVRHRLRRIGVMICYDMGFPRSRMLALQGLILSCRPSAWCQEDMDVWDVNAPARALENTAFVAAVNRYGAEDQLVMPRRSVCNPARPRGGRAGRRGRRGAVCGARPERSGRLSLSAACTARPSPRPYDLVLLP